MDFVHLQCQSEYSVKNSLVRVSKLIDSVKESGMCSVALTDDMSLFSAIKFYQKATSAGIKPIIGAKISVDFDLGHYDVLLLCQNQEGYLNLSELISKAYLNEQGISIVSVTEEQLISHQKGLLMIATPISSDVSQLLLANEFELAHTKAKHWKAIFKDRYYISAQRTDRHSDENLLNLSIELGLKLDIPVVATNDVQFLSKSDYDAHEARICIAEGALLDDSRRLKFFSDSQYLKTADEMSELFKDYPQLIANASEVAKRCNLHFKLFEKNYLPAFPTPKGKSIAEFFSEESNKGLQVRLKDLNVNEKSYFERLNFELSVILEMDFPGYFLIVSDFIRWAKENGIPVGPGRGSGAGSLVAWALSITNVDPIQHDLLFERFLNPERISMPDFDIDFCMDRREEVINYVQQKYGQDKVGQIITFGALLSKAAIRDIGRVLQMPYGQVDTLAKLIPVDGVRPVSIAKALTDEPRLKDAAKQEEIVSRLLDYSEKVEGLLRNASTHAAGVVIGDRPLDELVPLYQDPRSTMVATQFSMKWVELSGLVKFDFLGLKTLTVIQNALNLLKTRNVIIDIGNVPLDDQKTFELYASAKTVAVFQVESSGMMDALRRMKPTCIEDIVALVALYRPGPMENIPAYCEVKNGLKELVSIHPLIDHILAETQGIIVYQEQVMEIAQVMAGYSLGGADLLRRAMGKKIKEAMDAERPKFMKGAGSKGVDEKKASEVFDLLEKFANYGFNKSHAAAYAIVSYQTAWLKANYPLEFMAGVMNCDMHLTDKLSIYKDEIINGLSLKIVPPCVNRSEVDFSVKSNELIYALTALKNVGPEAMQLIVEARKKSVSKKFNDIFEFARQVDMKKIGKRPLEMLVRAGAFDQLNSNRLVLLKSLDSLVAYSSAIHDQRSSNQSSLFGVAGEDLLEPKLKEMDFWLASEQLVEEHRAIGFYLSGHPLDDYKSSLKRNGITTLSELRALVKNGPVIAKVAGTISGRQDRKSARGNRFSFVQVSDPTGLYEVTVFSDVLDSSEEYLVAGENVVMSVEATSEAEQLKLLCRTAQPIDTAIVDKSKKGLKIFVNSDGTISSVASLLKRVEQEKNVLGRGEVSICLIDSELPGEVELLVGDSYPINPQVYNALKALKGVLSVEEY